MADFYTLTCPTCGGKLQLTKDIERFACAHCGNEHIVKRSGGVVSLAPVMEQLEQVKASFDKTASELAIQRLKKEIQTIEQQIADVKNQSVIRQRQADERLSNVSGMFRLGCFFFVAIGLVLGWIGFQVGQYDFTFAWVGFLGVIGIVVGIYLGMQSMKEAPVQELTISETEQIRKLQAILTDRQLELQNHQKIVDV